MLGGTRGMSGVRGIRGAFRLFAGSTCLSACLSAAVVSAGAWALSHVSPARAEAKVVNAERGAVGTPAADFSLTDAAGKTVKLSDFAGKIVVLEWTNPDCPFVQQHYHDKTMATLAEKFKDKGVVWLAVNSDNGNKPDDLKKWSDDNHMAYPLLNDEKGRVAKAYDAKSTPHMFVIDKAGVIAYRGAIDNDPDGDKGANKVNYVQKALDDLLAGKSVSTPETKSYGCHVTQAS